MVRDSWETVLAVSPSKSVTTSTRAESSGAVEAGAVSGQRDWCTAREVAGAAEVVDEGTRSEVERRRRAVAMARGMRRKEPRAVCTGRGRNGAHRTGQDDDGEEIESTIADWKGIEGVHRSARGPSTTVDITEIT